VKREESERELFKEFSRLSRFIWEKDICVPNKSNKEKMQVMFLFIRITATISKVNK
jgi:hypothetical protein